MSTNKILNPLKVGLFGLLFVLSNYAFAATYYIDVTSGSDSNSGTSEAQAWKSLSKVNGRSFSPGDIISFKRGQTWNGNLRVSSPGTSGSPITYTAYGEGERPIIEGNNNVSTSWTLDSTHGANIYTTPSSIQPARLWLDDVEQYRSTLRNGRPEQWTEIGDTLSNGKTIRWTWSSGKLWYYSTSGAPTGVFSFTQNPTTFTISGKKYVKLSELDIRGGKKALDLISSSYITIEHCNIGYNSGTGISIPQTSSNLLIEYNTIDNNFKLDYTGVATYGGTDNRGSNDGVSVYGSMTDSEIRHNDFKNWGHCAISFTSFSASTPISNNKVHHNFITAPDIKYGRAFGYTGDGTTNNEFYRNYIYKQAVRSHMNGKNNHVHHNVFENIIDTPLKDKEQGQGTGVENFNGNPTGNVYEYNTFKDVDGPGIELVGSNNSNSDISGNTFHKNLFENCSRNSYYSNKNNAGIAVQDFVDVRANTFTDNAFVGADMIYHRGVRVSPADFNQRNGVAGDNISGNTRIVTDQGAGDVNKNNTGIGSTGTIPPAEEPSTPPPAEEPATGGAFIIDRSGQLY